MSKTVAIGDKLVGDGYPVYIVAEIGINHNGSVEIAKKLIDAAVKAGVDAVKFQKRTPEVSVPERMRNMMRETPWGYISYMEYRLKVEFGEREYKEIDKYCNQKGITWFVSVWDKPAVDFMEQFNPPVYKIPSAALTDIELLKHVRSTGKPMIISTGMSTMEQIQKAVEAIGEDNLIILHAHSAYPAPPEELNLKVIKTLKEKFDIPIGYSGHEVGLVTTVAAVALGANMVERHITLDRSMWGSDQAASVEPQGLERLVKYIRVVEKALGDGVKRVYDSELPAMKRLRRFNIPETK